ncbi:chitotriosidase-1 [Biomphalaria pfeifferi]|uniref:Chitotriosidase-1 n=1 Tax=Biomphalaria pfeifferi TaxID=112525 RepID=A0AAD8F470_BIOPF|nr:chitotriosidase-1 [Biomphalaria pfeifferi]
MERAISICFFLLTFVCLSLGQCKMLMCRFNPLMSSQSRLTTSYIDINLCPYIIIASVVNNEENVFTVRTPVKDLYPWILQSKRQNPKVKFVMAFYILTFYEMYLNPAKRSELFQACVRHLRDNGFDGLTVELNFGFWYGYGGESLANFYTKDRFADFMQDAQNAFTDEARRTGKPKLLLFGNFPIYSNIILRDYNVPRMYNSSDYIIYNVLSHGAHWWTAWETIEALGRRHHSRIYKLDPDDKFNLDYYIKWIVSVGGIKSKTIVSIELRGLFYYNDREYQYEPNYNRIRDLSYGEMCDFLRKGGRIARASNINPFHIYDRMLTFYDDEFSVKERIKYIKKTGLAGFNYAYIEGDDFRDNCGRGKWPLLRALSEECSKT